MKRLTDENIQEIIDLYSQGVASKTIAEKFGIFDNSVARILRKKGIARDKVIRVPQKDIDYIIKTYSEGVSSTKIAAELNISDSTVGRILKRNNITIRPPEDNKRKYKINERFFQIIDTEEKAYYLGFLYADGNLSSSSGEITIRLHSQDIDVLQTLSNIIYGFEKLRTDTVTKIEDDGTTTVTNYIAFNVYSKRMHQDLQNLGCMPNKSFLITFPSAHVPAHLMRHFIRGLIDGDGCLDEMENHRYRVDLVSTIEMLEGFNQWSIQTLNIDFGKMYCRFPERETNTRNVQLKRQEDVKKFLDYIYNNATVCMKRKHNLYLDFIYHYNNKLQIKSNKLSNIQNYNTTYVPEYEGTPVTAEFVKTLSEEERDKVATELTAFYRQNGFPYVNLSDDELIKEFSSIRKAKLEKVCDGKILNLNNGIGNNVFKHFAPHFYEMTTGIRKDKPSMYAAFNDDALLKKIILNRFDQNFTINGNMIRQGLANSNIAFKGSIFNTSLAKYIYTQFTKTGDLIYDYSMGFGQRLLAALSLSYPVKYIGVDPFEKTVESNENIYAFYSKNIPGLNKEVDIVCCGSENYFDSNYENKVDLAFSSPPYFNLEIYENNISQANSTTYQSFIHNYWENTVKNTVRMLKDGAHFILNIKDIVDGFLLSEDMLNICYKHGLKLVDTYKIQLTKHTNFKNKSGEHKFEPIYVLQK